MHPVRVPPAPSTARAGLPETIPAAPPTTPRTVAFLDALCPRCEQRGLALAPGPSGQALLVCLHCGHVGDA